MIPSLLFHYTKAEHMFNKKGAMQKAQLLYIVKSINYACLETNSAKASFGW